MKGSDELEVEGPPSVRRWNLAGWEIPTSDDSASSSSRLRLRLRATMAFAGLLQALSTFTECHRARP